MMRDHTLLLADHVHINEKNFASLLAFCRDRGIHVQHPRTPPLPTDAFGDYQGVRSILSSARSGLEQLPAPELFAAKRKGIGLFKVSRAEILCCLMAREHRWLSDMGRLTDAALFERILDKAPDVLLDNLCAAAIWIDYWSSVVHGEPRLSYAGVFSGSLTYARSLLETMRLSPGRCFVLESFFTGLHYYCEERYYPIANSTDLRHPTVRRSLGQEPNSDAYESKRNLLRQSLLTLKNKNVTQPSPASDLLFSRDRPTLLVLGQVINDFSLLDSAAGRIHSVHFYKRLIEAVLSATDWNVIFKAHPWERRKQGLNGPVTFEALQQRFPGCARLKLVEDRALVDLFRECEAVACINSQAGIEAALAGFKPFQFGGAFWGGNGFSHDLAIDGDAPLLEALSNREGLRLSLREFDSLERWLLLATDRWLVDEAPNERSQQRLSQLFYEVAASDSPSVKFTPASRRLGGWEHALRRMRKLVLRPDEFLRDSRHPALRLAGTVLFARTRLANGPLEKAARS